MMMLLLLLLAQRRYTALHVQVPCTIFYQEIVHFDYHILNVLGQIMGKKCNLYQLSLH